MTALHALRGANLWSTRPVTRMDVVVGGYEHIASADVPGFTEALRHAMPGLIEHRCSIGERGGFIARLRRGTYAAHIIEHVALELQFMTGHDVGYGKTRGGDVPGEYTLVFEHRHASVGLRAAALALDIVQRAFAGTLGSVDCAVAELRALADAPDAPALRQHVLCGISGGALRHETQTELMRRGIGGDTDAELVVDVAPSFILQAGLPYSHSRLAIILDADPVDVPERYRAPEHARKLVSVLTDAVTPDGTVITPARDWELQDYARDAGRRVAIFAADGQITAKDKKVAAVVATVEDGRIVIEHGGELHEAGPAREAAAVPQVAAALAAHILRNGSS